MLIVLASLIEIENDPNYIHSFQFANHPESFTIDSGKYYASVENRTLHFNVLLKPGNHILTYKCWNEIY